MPREKRCTSCGRVMYDEYADDKYVTICDYCLDAEETYGYE